MGWGRRDRRHPATLRAALLDDLLIVGLIVVVGLFSGHGLPALPLVVATAVAVVVRIPT